MTEETPAPVESVVEDNSSDLIAKANAAAERLEQANANLEKNLARQEKMFVEKTLGGKTTAGKTEIREETPEEYAAKVMANDI